MKQDLRKKINLLLKSRKVFKNWYMCPIVYFKLINQKYVIFETRSGLKIKLRVNSTDLMALTHVWLIQEYSNPDFKINDTDIIIDVGSHIGLFSLFASQFCKNGKIYCFEPVKENFDLLSSNIELNQITNIVSFNLAVSDESTIVKIFINNDESGHSMFYPTSTAINIRSITLKKIFDDNNIEECNFLKLDCEGAEYNIIDSLPNDYFTKIKKMIIEYHLADTKPELLERLIKKLEKFYVRIIRRALFSDIGFLYVNKQKNH